jgi:hypothetical protein
VTVKKKTLGALATVLTGVFVIVVADKFLEIDVLDRTCGAAPLSRTVGFWG